MVEQVERPFFTVAVFQDAQWATRCLDALTDKGFEPEILSVVARKGDGSPDVVDQLTDKVHVQIIIEQTFDVGDAQQVVVTVSGLGESYAHGRLVDALQGDDNGLVESGVAATMRRAGFQAHDGFIFETLLSRGGVLVAVESESRAADALALFHSYGGGNAAIGAWRGRV